MSVKFEDLEIFVAIVEANSISRAADNLDMPKSRVSRHLKELEEELGERLLERTTRSIRLTEAGDRFYQGSLQMLDNMEALRNEVVSDRSKIDGRLTVFSPAEFMSQLLEEHLGEFSRRYPALEIEFLSGAARPDLLHDRLDVIIHPDPPEDSSFVAQQLCRGRTDFFASPTYLAQHGQPQHPSELYHHSCIAELNQSRQPRPWLYREQRKTRELRIQPRYRCDSVATACSLARQGLGVVMLPVFIGEASVAQGRLVQLFDGKYEVTHGIFAIYSSRRLKPRKLEVFLEFMKEVLPESI
jgi:DNA-binding transcriptional LysR family regulator